MTTTPTSTTVAARRSPLTDAERDRVAAALQPLLVDLVDLSLVAKQAHWTVVGPRFRELHLELDEIATVVRAEVDAVAERLAAIGVVPDGRAVAVAGSSTLEGVPAEWLADERVVRLVADAVESVVRRARATRRDVADDDPVTDDLVTGLTSRLEERLWMLSAQER